MSERHATVERRVYSGICSERRPGVSGGLAPLPGSTRTPATTAPVPGRARFSVAVDGRRHLDRLLPDGVDDWQGAR